VVLSIFVFVAFVSPFVQKLFNILIVKSVAMINGKWNVSDIEKQLLMYFSILPDRFFSFNELMEYFQISAKNDVEFFDTLHDLTKTGYIEREGKFYSMAFQSKVQIIKQLQPRYSDCKLIITYFNNQFFLKEGETYQTKEPLIPFVESILLAVNEAHQELIRLATNLAIVLNKLNQKTKALDYNLLAIQLGEQINYRYLDRAYHNTAELYYELKNYRKSVEYSLRFVYLKERNATQLSDLQELANHYYNIAVLYYDMMDFANAKRYIDKVVDFDKRILDEEHPDFIYDLKLQKRIHFAYKVSRHLFKYLKFYLLFMVLILLLSLGLLIFG